MSEVLRVYQSDKEWSILIEDREYSSPPHKHYWKIVRTFFFPVFVFVLPRVDDKIENSGPSMPALDESKITDIQIGDDDDEMERGGTGDIVSNAARAIREDLEKEEEAGE